MSDSTVPTSAAIAAAKKLAETLRAAAEKAETAAQEAERADCDMWACGGSHTDLHPGQGYKVVQAKAVAKAVSAAADRAQEAYDDLLAQAS
jgi:hypothetical protein